MSDQQDKIADTDEMEDFFTRDGANAGIVVELTNKWGEKTERWMRVLGIDSDAYQEAEVIHFRRQLEIAQIKDEDARKAARDEAERRLVASLVSGWSFAKPCTVDNVAAFFQKSPQNKKLVDNASFNRALFFKRRPDNSSGTPKPSSDSTDTPPVPSNPSAQA